MLVVEANNRGEPFVKLGPDAQITKDVARIAHRLATEIAAPATLDTRRAGRRARRRRDALTQ